MTRINVYEPLLVKIVGRNYKEAVNLIRLISPVLNNAIV